MARKKERPRDVVAITPNQIVAFNLSEARSLRGWTQEQAAAELEQYVGSRWSKATFSAAERSVDGRRVRQFTADEIVAFSRCFRVPIGFFFMPPRPSQVEQPVVLSTPERHGYGIRLAELLDVIFGTPGEREALSVRLHQFLDELPLAELTDAQDRLTWRAEDAITAVRDEAARSLRGVGEVAERPRPPAPLMAEPGEERSDPRGSAAGGHRWLTRHGRRSAATASPT